jgi:hypothetical protein
MFSVLNINKIVPAIGEKDENLVKVQIQTNTLVNST